MKRGRTASVFFAKDLPYMGDDYNAKKKKAREEIKGHNDTMLAMLGDDFKPFSQRAARKGYHGNFNTIRSILGESPLPEIPKRHASQ